MKEKLQNGRVSSVHKIAYGEECYFEMRFDFHMLAFTAISIIYTGIHVTSRP